MLTNNSVLDLLWWTQLNGFNFSKKKNAAGENIEQRGSWFLMVIKDIRCPPTPRVCLSDARANTHTHSHKETCQLCRCSCLEVMMDGGWTYHCKYHRFLPLRWRLSTKWRSGRGEWFDDTIYLEQTVPQEARGKIIRIARDAKLAG